MERSIENIWKKGFEAEKRLSPPVISNLYKRKSRLIIQQINRTSKWDNLSLLPIAVILFGVLAFMGKIIAGIYVAALILALFYFNKTMLKELQNLDLKENTYSYLVRYRNQLQTIMKYTTWLIGLGLPLVAIPAYWLFFQGSKMLTKIRELDLALEILFIFGLAVFLSMLGIVCYRLTTKIVYGRLLAKLESTIENMEELMKT